MERKSAPPTLVVMLKKDQLVHFKRDGPYVRLAALFMCMLPYIITAIGGVAIAVCKALGKL